MTWPAAAGATLVAEGHREDPANATTVRWPTILLAWSIPAALAALQSLVNYLIHGRLSVEWPWVIQRGTKLFSWALVTPLVLLLGQRFPIVRGKYLQHGVIHACVALTLAFLYEFIWFQLNRILSLALHETGTVVSPGLSPGAAQLTLIITSLASNSFVYVAVIAIGATIERDRRLQERDLATAKLETQLAQAQMQALKMRVHPHFLFNALHAVTVLINEAPAAATLMVVRLGDLLRLSLSRTASAEVAVERELEMLRLYLEVEQVRFRDRLTVHYDVADETHPALVPDLVLQPLVENAIKHGFATNRDGGTITIRLRRSGGELVIEIEDNGRGLGEGSPAAEGIGLTTTRERLAALYGPAHQLVLSTPPGGGLLVRVALPFHTESRREE